ncbi:Mini-ribonuclease 3 [Aphanothece hegewaldii CCALA 016]|uniref:Mini-ribonuclease 3 n=2 Tax=Aphanothece TaxID=1121 RepID=A0A2T1LX87_9CHRO|nr:Mini-ribonuclease 3 [Aphanothece hegewaldii CCALA 016]
MDDSDLLRLQFILRVEKSAIPVAQLSPTSLAYIGDAVYELYIRTHFLLPPKKISDYHNQVVSKVRAETQAAYLQELEPYLTESEQNVIRRGRNGAKREPKRLSPQLYQQASSLETLIGYLYLSDPQRLKQLLGKLKLD